MPAQRELFLFFRSLLAVTLLLLTLLVSLMAAARQKVGYSNGGRAAKSLKSAPSGCSGNIRRRLNACKAALSTGSVPDPSSTPCTGLYGRIVRLKPPATIVARLSKDPERLKVVFVMGDDELAKMIGKKGIDRLVAIGLHRGGHQGTFPDSPTFKLLVFSEGSIGGKPPPAMWSALVRMAAMEYPAVRKKLMGQLKALESTSFKTIQSIARYTFSTVLSDGPNGRYYITPEQMEGLRGSLEKVFAAVRSGSAWVRC